MTKNEYPEFCGTIAAAISDTPFENDAESVVIRHLDTRKWFAPIMVLN